LPCKSKENILKQLEFETLQEETPMSPDSRDLADYEAYIWAELLRLVRFNIEEVVRRDMQPLEASLIGNLVGIIRDCQDRVFRSYRETQRRRDEGEIPARGEVQGGFLGPSSDLMNSDSGYASEQMQFCDCQGPCNSVGKSTIPHVRSQDSSNNFNPQELGCENILGNGWDSTPSWTELNSMENDFDWMNDV
jgi:hypothetical protein